MSDVLSRSEHIFHVWINRRQDQRRANGQAWERDLYEFKSMMQFLAYGHEQIKQAYTGTLPVIHQQCSLSPVEQVANNCLRCAFGTDVTKCEILSSLKATFDEERQREVGNMGKLCEEVPDEQMYRRMACVCAWHMYTEQINGKFLDTSEGYLTDETDRLLWSRVCESMTGQDPEDAA